MKNIDNKELENLISIKEACKILGISRSTLYRLSKLSKDLPKYKIGRRILFKPSELKEYINKNKISVQVEEVSKKRIDVRDDLLDKLKNLIKENKNILIAYLYGSQATGRAGVLSDIDIGILVKDDINKEDYMRLEIEIASSINKDLPGKVIDLRIINNAPLDFCYRVIKEGKLIFERKIEDRVNFEVSTIRNYLEFNNFYKTYRDYFFRKIREVGIID
jgi:hypothetical protein